MPQVPGNRCNSSRFCFPIHHTQSWNSSELSGIVGHKREVLRPSNGSNKEVVGAYQRALLSQYRTNLAIFLRRLAVERLFTPAPPVTFTQQPCPDTYCTLRSTCIACNLQ